MSDYSVIMTFPTKNWDVYGKYSLPSFEKHWPKEVNAYVYVEGDQNIPFEPSDRIHILNFDNHIFGALEFAEKYKDKDIFDDKVDGDISKRQAVKFSKKVYAQLAELRNPKTRYVIYLDADLMTLQDVSLELLDNLTSGNHYVAFPDRRKRNKFTETGMLIWDTHHEQHSLWCSLYDSMYKEGKIFDCPEWHDCFAFDTVTFDLEKRGLIKCADLGYGTHARHPIVAGPLGKYFDHLKGGRKWKGFSNERIQAHGV